MKDELLALIGTAKSPVEARNQAREYLQALILHSLQRTGAMTMLAFHGGTALRFLYSLPRYSEAWISHWSGRPGVMTSGLFWEPYAATWKPRDTRLP